MDFFDPSYFEEKKNRFKFRMQLHSYVVGIFRNNFYSKIIYWVCLNPDQKNTRTLFEVDIQYDGPLWKQAFLGRLMGAAIFATAK